MKKREPDFQFKVGDRVIFGNGHRVWEVVAQVGDYLPFYDLKAVKPGSVNRRQGVPEVSLSHSPWSS